MPISKITLNKFLFAKMFIGGLRSRWNPEIVGYLSGARHNIYILNVVDAAFRLRKFLMFTQLCAQRRGRLLFVVPKAFSALNENIYPNSYYISDYLGGVISNFKNTYKKLNSQSLKKVPSFPFAIIGFNDYTRRVDFLVNESIVTRTPCALLADSSHSALGVSYSILSSSDFNTAKIMVDSVIAAIKKGKRQEKVNFRTFLKNYCKKIVKSQKPLLSSARLVSTFWKSSILTTNVEKKLAAFYYLSHFRLMRLFPQNFITRKQILKYNKINQNISFVLLSNKQGLINKFKSILLQINKLKKSPYISHLLLAYKRRFLSIAALRTIRLRNRKLLRRKPYFNRLRRNLRLFGKKSITLSKVTVKKLKKPR